MTLYLGFAVMDLHAANISTFASLRRILGK